MKKLLLAAAIFLVYSHSMAQGIVFKTGAWNEAVALAKKENKLLFIDLYFEGCMPCAQMDKTTFVDPQVSAFMNEHFVSYKTDVMKEEDGKELTVRYAASGFPTYMFLSPEGKTLDVFSGYTAVSVFKTLAEKAVENNAGKKFLAYSVAPSLKQFPAFYADPYLDRQKKTEPGAGAAFLDQQTDLRSENAFLVMSRLSLNEKYNRYFLEHAGELAALYGRMPVRNKLINILSVRASTYGKTGDRKKLDETLAIARPIFTDKEWPRFHKIFVENYIKTTWDTKEYAAFIRTSGLYDWEDKVTAVAQVKPDLPAEKWAEMLPVLDDEQIPAFEKTYMKGFVYFRMDRKEEALKALKEAADLPGGRPNEYENAKKFIAWLGNGGKEPFQPAPVYRMKPLLAD